MIAGFLTLTQHRKPQYSGSVLGMRKELKEMPREQRSGDTDKPAGGRKTGNALDQWKHRASVDGAADWTAVDGRYMAAAAAALGSAGGAIRFGYSRDGGAYAVGIYLGKDSHTDWIKPGESVEDYLQSVIENFAPKLG